MNLQEMLLFRRLELFFDDPKRIILVGDLNAILDPKVDKAGRGGSGSARCESSLIVLMAQHDLVNWFILDHPGREMWTWLDSLTSVCIRTYLDRVLSPNLLGVPCSTGNG